MVRGTGAVDAAPHTGTTIVAVTYNGGVVIGADSRVSTGDGGFSSFLAPYSAGRLADEWDEQPRHIHSAKWNRYVSTFVSVKQS